MTLFTTDYLEYYLTLVSWIVHNGIWAVLVASGVFALPFIAIIVQEWLKARAEALVQEINRCNADLEKCHPLDRGFLTDRRNEAIAKHTGTMEACEIVAGLKNNLERLTGWHD